MTNHPIFFFFPHNPYPPRTGAHKRCLELLSGLKELGGEVILLSSTMSSESEWLESSRRSLEAEWVKSVRIYEASKFDYRFKANLQRFYHLTGRRPPVDSALYTPPGMRRWFRRMAREFSPRVIFMSYAHWDKLLDHRRISSTLRVIDTIDLATLNQKMQQALDKYLCGSRINAEDVNELALREDFYERIQLTADQGEYDVFDRYDVTIAIAAVEANIINRHSRNTKVVLLRMTQEPVDLRNSHTGPALFPIGPNPFNIQGYVYFVKKVLPLVIENVPSFTLQVTGSFYNGMTLDSAPGVVIKGFVPDLKPIYEECRFVICPVMGGTGQQVKIVEAMAHGVPVIALRAAAERSPMKHGVNGLIADNAREFANYVVQLWQDQYLCRKLGQAARETIASEFSRTQLLDGLSQIISSAER